MPGGGDGGGGFFSQIIPWLSGGGSSDTGAGPNWAKLLTGGMAGAGEISNILASHQQSAWNNYLADLAKNPAKLAAMIQKLQQPLSRGYTEAISNKVQADLASRGLAQAPGIFAGTMAQALAPAQMAQQQEAERALFAALGMPHYPGATTNIAPALQSFFSTMGIGKPGGGGGTAPLQGLFAQYDPSQIRIPTPNPTAPEWSGTPSFTPDISGFPDITASLGGLSMPAFAGGS